MNSARAIAPPPETAKIEVGGRRPAAGKESVIADGHIKPRPE
jgi:hypothetical protein